MTPARDMKGMERETWQNNMPKDTEANCVYCHMLKKKIGSVGRKYFVLILFSITELMLDDI